MHIHPDHAALLQEAGDPKKVDPLRVAEALERGGIFDAVLEFARGDYAFYTIGMLDATIIMHPGLLSEGEIRIAFNGNVPKALQGAPEEAGNATPIVIPTGLLRLTTLVLKKEAGE